MKQGVLTPVQLDGDQWVVLSCPYCQKRHRHTALKDRRQPQSEMSSRSRPAR
jgi:hypothetical protein